MGQEAMESGEFNRACNQFRQIGGFDIAQVFDLVHFFEHGIDFRRRGRVPEAILRAETEGVNEEQAENDPPAGSRRTISACPIPWASISLATMQRTTGHFATS